MRVKDTKNSKHTWHLFGQLNGHQELLQRLHDTQEILLSQMHQVFQIRNYQTSSVRSQRLKPEDDQGLLLPDYHQMILVPRAESTGQIVS